MSRINYNNERHMFWLAVVEATRIAQKGIAPLVQQEFEDWHQKLFNSSTLKICKPCICKPCNCTMGKVATCASCVCCSQRKRNHCPECADIQRELERSYRSPMKSKLCWQNSTCKQWRTEPWEVAKVFLGRLGSRAGKTKDANSTDISGLITLIECCLFNTMPVNRAVLFDVRDTRNMWAHEAEMEFSENEMHEAFTVIESLLKDAVFLKDEDAKNALKELKELQDPNNRPHLLKKKEIDLMAEVSRVVQYNAEELQYTQTSLLYCNIMLERATARYSNLVKERNAEKAEKRKAEEAEGRKKKPSERTEEISKRELPNPGEGATYGGSTGAIVGGTLGSAGGPLGTVFGGATGAA